MFLRILIWFSAFLLVSPYKILVYNVRFSHSCSNFMGMIADILVDAGHQVDVLIPIIDREGHDGIHKANPIYVERETNSEMYMKLFKTEVNLFDLDYDRYANNRRSYGMMSEMFVEQCNRTVHAPNLIRRLTDAKYDLFITETLDFCGVGIHHLIKARTMITVATTPVFDKPAEYLGVPIAPSFNPAWTTSKLDVHSMWSRLWNLYRHWMRTNTFVGMENCDRLFRTLYGPDFPPLTELISHSAYYLTNSEPYIDFGRPLLKKVVELGGLAVRDPKPLDTKWDKILSTRRRTVLLSFGTVVMSYRLDIEYKRSILKALSEFPDTTFIWKYERLDDDFARNEATKVTNVVLVDWVPQSDILNDKRIVAFISHAGMGSCQEAAARGVPGIFIPAFADQPRNAAMMEHTGLGFVFSKYDVVHSEKLAAAIRTILEEKRYTEKARKISRMLAKRPFTPRETLIKHVEFAAEFGTSENLRPESVDMSVIELYNLDLLFLALAVPLVLLYLVYALLRCLACRKQKLKAQ